MVRSTQVDFVESRARVQSQPSRKASKSKNTIPQPEKAPGYKDFSHIQKTSPTIKSAKKKPMKHIKIEVSEIKTSKKKSKKTPKDF